MKIAKSLLKKIEAEALAAYPREACGLLLGTPGGDEIKEAVPSKNLARARDEFMIDPAVQTKIQREARVSGEVVIGAYHSHPSGDSKPSQADKKGTPNPGFYWLISTSRPNFPKITSLFCEIRPKTGEKGRGFTKVFLQILDNEV